MLSLAKSEEDFNALWVSGAGAHVRTYIRPPGSSAIYWKARACDGGGEAEVVMVFDGLLWCRGIRGMSGCLSIG